MEEPVSSNGHPGTSSKCIQTKMNASGEPIDNYEALETPNSASSYIEIEPVKTNGQHIDDYISPHGEKMSFFYFFNHATPVWVQLHNNTSTEKLIPLWMPELNENQNRDSIFRMVRRSLRSIHIRPEYYRMEKRVRFSSTHSKDKRNKDWILQSDNLPLTRFNAAFVYQSDGSISYVNRKNEIINWKKGSRLKKDLISSSNITALAEQNGDLIVGCEDGKIFVPRLNKSNRSKTSSVVEIAAIGSSHFAVRYRDDSANLFSIEEGTISHPTHFQKISKIWSVRDRFFVALRDKRVLRFVDIYEEKIYEKTFSSELQPDNVIVVPDTVCVVANDEISIWEGGNSWNIFNKENFFTIWRSHGGKICERNCARCLKHQSEIDRKITYAEESWQDLMKSIKEKTCIFLSPGTFIFPQIPHSWLIFITYFSINENRPIMFHGDGIWGVRSMLLLSDGSLMYATKENPSGIYVITNEGECIFSKQEKLFHKQERVISLKEFEDGSVAVEYFDSNKKFIKIISTRGQSQEIINHVNELRSQLAENPIQLDLYDELVKLYLPINQFDFSDHHFAYRTYLDGLETAVQAKNFYDARRFYEKARNIFPDREEPVRLFLSHLMNFPNTNVERRIQLDLFELMENKKCKLRLFVGEGDFSYTESLIKKHIHTHKQLSQSVVATELLEPQQMNDSEIDQRIERLKEYKVIVLTGIDGQQIHEHAELKDWKFKRIHWNCPFNPDDRDSFRQVIPNFFRSCEKIQSTGNRIHVTLMQGWEDDEWHERRQYENPIVKGSVESAYRLIRKRRFGEKRYPGYQHRSTRGGKLDLPGELREFVFEKVPSSVYKAEVTGEKIRNSLPIKNAQKKYCIKVNNKKSVGLDEIKPENCYFDCSTDDDSSDYYSD